MRIKITAKQHGIEKLVFGKRYGIAYIASSIFEEFTFTRKNKIEMCEYDDKGKKVTSRWISKNELKQIINSEFVHWMGKHIED